MVPTTKNKDKPGLLEYLEDIIGSDVYIEKINELESHIEEDQEIKFQLQAKTKLTKEALDGLEGTKNEAIKYAW